MFTSDQILALAPDPSSAKAGQGLASRAKWVTVGRQEQAVWGECQGSGAKPYQTQIDLGEPALRCSCPSRKFPCKHGLGLFLLLANSPAAFAEGDPPAWVEEWLKQRAGRAEKQARKAEEGQSAETTEEAEARARRAARQRERTAAERSEQVAAGLKELDLWLRDLVRQGLASLPSRPHNFWESVATRMMDSKAQELERLVRQLAGIPGSGEGWPDRVLERLAQLFLIREGYRHLEAIPQPLQEDLRHAIGWTMTLEDLDPFPGVRDQWLVLGQSLEHEQRLRTQRIWLWGRETGRPALVLHRAPPSQPLDASLVAGTIVDAEIVFYPGLYPLRVRVRQRHSSPIALDGFPCNPNLAEAVRYYGTALGLQPWLERFPMPVADVVPVQDNGRWLARDAEGDCVPLTLPTDRGWQLLALSGGHPFHLFGEWNGEALAPLAVWAEGRYYHLGLRDA